MEANLKLARKIVCSFIVNTKEHPEYLTDNWNTVSCERNSKVGHCMEAIDNLIKSL